MNGAKNGKSSKVERKVKRITPENLPSIYTNAIEIKLSVFDVILLLGEVQEATAKELVVKTDARIIMSPQHAKALATMLTRKMEQYEKEFGPLPYSRKPTPLEDESGNEAPTSAIEPEQPS